MIKVFRMSEGTFFMISRYRDVFLYPKTVDNPIYCVVKKILKILQKNACN